MGSDPKTPTAPRVVTGKISKKVPSLKLLAAFTALIPEEKVFMMSWDSQVAAEEGSNTVSRAENALKSAQILQVPVFGPLNMIYGSAKSSS